MAKVNIEAAQNVEISKKFPCEKSLQEQLEIMERYTAVHRAHLEASKEMREAACLEVLYPTLFRRIQEGDRIAGRLDFLPIDLVPREASGAAIGITGIASYAAAGIQMIVTGLLLDNHILPSGAHDYTYVSWFWLGAAAIAFLLPLLNWRRKREALPGNENA